MDRIILKWFDILGFPEEWREAVTAAVKTFNIEAIEKNENPFDWLFTQEDKMMGMLYALCKCEDFFENGKAKGIPESILTETMQEVRRHSMNYHRSSGGKKIGIYQIRWAGTVLSGRLYCLGRLEFEMRTTKKSWEKGGIIPGDKVISIHIPRTGGPMTDEEVEESFRMAEEFLPKFFPDHDYKCYTCHSWLLDPALRKLLKPDSNIIRFMDRFDVVETNPSTSALGIIFGVGTTYENVLEKNPQTSLQKAAQEYIRNGGTLGEGFGFIKR